LSKPIVYIVHAVDVEGPMTETIDATFDRLRAYGLPNNITASKKNLSMIQKGEYPNLTGELSKTLKKIFNPHSLNYFNSWKEIDEMLDRCNSNEFRYKYIDSTGSPYKFSWFIYDHHEGFFDNPRYHDVGTHRIFDHYMDSFLKKNKHDDGIYWHYHASSMNGNALESNTCWTNHNFHENIIARRIIERKWYFSCFRAGLHLERNDLSWWLEMFSPFDFSARYTSDESIIKPGSDFDWRNCPERWGAWHPDWYDYRKEGNMKRWQFRCTDLWTYLNILNDEEVEDAFNQAELHGDSVLTYYNHDYRDMCFEIDEGYKVIQDVAKRHPDVEWKFVTAEQAAQYHLKLNPKRPKIKWELNDTILIVKTDIEIFGPQPFLAINEKGKYFRDNFTDEGNNTWVYEFRNINDLIAFGVAANSSSGLYNIIVHEMDKSHGIK